MEFYWSPQAFHLVLYPIWSSVLLLALLTAIVILGGLSRISKTAEKLVPTMVLFLFRFGFGYSFSQTMKRFRTILKLILQMPFQPAFIRRCFPGRHGGWSHFAGNPSWGFQMKVLVFSLPWRMAQQNQQSHSRPDLWPCWSSHRYLGGPVVNSTLPFWRGLADQWCQRVSLTAFIRKHIPTIGKYGLMVCGCFIISSFSYSYYGTKCMSFLFGAHRTVLQYFLHWGVWCWELQPI